MFVGRLDEIVAIERNLFQAKNGNPQHFLVQGERGIGKSSLLFYIEIEAAGKVTGSEGEEPFNFLTVSIDLGGCQTQLDIIRKLGRGIRSAVDEREAIKKSAKAFWDWLTNWEVLGVKFNKSAEEIDAEEIAEELVKNLAVLCRSTESDIDGVLILIDESDRPPVEAHLGQFLKMLTERLARKDCNHVLIGIAGLPTILSKLRESHESSPRLFHTMLLEPLTRDERKRVVEIGLAEANLKNDPRVEITTEALDTLADLSEGYPHFVQQFAYSAFEQDHDNRIDEDDVVEGAFRDGGALSQLGDKYFNDMYHARISSEDYRRVLDAMAEHGDDWIPRKTIIKESGVSESNVNNALASLKAKEIILADDTRRGFYRLPTNSFAAWINAVRSARAKSDASRDDL